MKINFDINLTRKQQEAYDLIHSKDCKLLVARWSRQCGKTIFAEIMLIEYLFKPNTFNAFISPTHEHNKTVYSQLMKLLGDTGIIKKANGNDLIIETIYNSSLHFFSMAAPVAIRGKTVSGILVMDEVGYFPKQLPSGEDPWYNVIYPITRPSTT